MSNKIKNAIKSNTKAIVNAIDLSTGGLITQVKTNFSNTYKGYLEEKISNLILDLQSNSIREEEILEYIENMNNYDKEIVFAIIQKTINSENKIKRFLLSKVWLYKIKNINLDYFHSSLLSSLELFTERDFRMVYEISKIGVRKDDEITMDISKLESYYQSTLQKLKSIGFINGGVIDGGSFDENEDNFYIFDYYLELEKILIEFYEERDKS
ncbi:hypothetical protein OZY48_06350 [Aliarcobacter cryaerophilus]|uniref:hypothetical protein n=1 Tax=Aliarcobacter cryaerophilus TaxID=28198 RepID=UPI003BB168C1